MVFIVGFLDPTPIVLPSRTRVNPTIERGDSSPHWVLPLANQKRQQIAAFQSEVKPLNELRHSLALNKKSRKELD
jgi:hypothetical protein